MAGKKKHALRSHKGYKEHVQLKFYLKGKDPHARVY